MPKNQAAAKLYGAADVSGCRFLGEKNMKRMAGWWAGGLVLCIGAVCFGQQSPHDPNSDFAADYNGVMSEVRGCAGDSCAQEPSRYFQSLGFKERRQGREWTWQGDTADGKVTINVERTYFSSYVVKLLYRIGPESESIAQMTLVARDDNATLETMPVRLAPFLGEDGTLRLDRVVNHPPIREKFTVAAREYETYAGEQARTVDWLREHGFDRVQDLVLYNNAASWRRRSKNANIPQLVQVDIFKRYQHTGGKFPRATRDIGKLGSVRIVRWDSTGGDQVLRGDREGSFSLTDFLSASNLKYMESLLQEMDRGKTGLGSN
ncbi:MAG: hypothetical protein HY077_16700 [Elusimicrobia bacterium]|nr:hypothetical protein [Elusimicrobiota bacterium]